MQGPGEISEVVQIILEHEEEESREGTKNDGKLHYESAESNEAESNRRRDLHEGLVETDQSGDLQSGGEHSEGQDILIILVEQGWDCQPDVGVPPENKTLSLPVPMIAVNVNVLPSLVDPLVHVCHNKQSYSVHYQG